MTKKLPVELQVEKEKTNRELAQEALSGIRQVGVVLANSPTFQMIGGLLTVELLQMIKIKEKPIISDTLANTMTGFIIGKTAVSSISDLFSLLNPFD